MKERQSPTCSTCRSPSRSIMGGEVLVRLTSGGELRGDLDASEDSAVLSGLASGRGESCPMDLAPTESRPRPPRPAWRGWAPTRCPRCCSSARRSCPRARRSGFAPWSPSASWATSRSRASRPRPSHWPKQLPRPRTRPPACYRTCSRSVKRLSKSAERRRIRTPCGLRACTRTNAHGFCHTKRPRRDSNGLFSHSN